MGAEQSSGQIITQLARMFEHMGTGWVLWLLIILSVISVAVMLERVVYFKRHSFGDVDELLKKLAAGDLDNTIKFVGDRRGLEAEVFRQGTKVAARGAEAVEEIIKATIVRERLRYERFLSFLGTLGNNAPFIGLFGTVLGIIKAFAALAINAQAGTVTVGAANIMTGISEALVATAMGLLVALPAVAAYNTFGRWLKTVIARSEAVGYALTSYLKSIPDNSGDGIAASTAASS